MKNNEEIKNEINFAIDNKKLTGFLEKDQLYVECPRIYFTFILFLITVPIFGIGILAFIAYLGFRLRYFYWIPVTYLLIGSIICNLCKDYIVFNYNRGQFYFSTKFYGITIWTGYYLDVRNILEIGIDHVYLPQKNNYILQLFKKKEEDIFEKVSKPCFVYLNSEGKKKNFFAHFYEKKFDENLKNYCEIIGSVLEIPAKISNYNQQLRVVAENNAKYFEIIPFDLKAEKRKIFKIKLIFFLIQFSIPFIITEIFLYLEYGFIGSLYAWAYIFKKMFTEYIPRELGLK